MQTILIVEDDPATLLLLRRSLEPEGYKILSRTSGLDVVPTVRQEGPSLIILDRRLPGLDGFEVCRQLRARSDVPILMLTASADEVDRVLGLSLGAGESDPQPDRAAEADRDPSAPRPGSGSIGPPGGRVIHSAGQQRRESWKGDDP